jgi:hypothetical protein
MRRAPRVVGFVLVLAAGCAGPAESVRRPPAVAVRAAPQVPAADAAEPEPTRSSLADGIAPWTPIRKTVRLNDGKGEPVWYRDPRETARALADADPELARGEAYGPSYEVHYLPAPAWPSFGYGYGYAHGWAGGWGPGWHQAPAAAPVVTQAPAQPSAPTWFARSASHSPSLGGGSGGGHATPRPRVAR